MKKELWLSFLIHICGLSIIPIISLKEKKPSYPTSVYQVSLNALRANQGTTQLTSEEPKLTDKGIKEKKAQGKEKAKEKKVQETSQTRNVPYGGKISTEGGEFKYSYYLDIIIAKVGENWRNPYEGEGGKIAAVVYFIVKKNGEIDKIWVEKSSGNYYFDQSALKAVQSTKNLPPLPDEFERGWLGVYFEFEYVQ